MITLETRVEQHGMVDRTIATATAGGLFELPTASFLKVRHRAVLWQQLLTCKETALDAFQAGLCLFLGAELDVNVANKVVTQVFAHGQLLNVTVFAEFFENLITRHTMKACR